MASKLWIYGKKITLWGALVSSLPFMFIPMLALLAFGIAISVPLGCAVGAYVCFRKVLSGLARKRLIACKGENSEMKKNEAGSAGFGVCLEGSDVNEECSKRKSELVGHSQVQYEELRSEAGEDVDINIYRGESPIYEEGYESKIYEVESLEEQPHRLKSYEEPHHLEEKLCESETPLKWDPHDLPSVGGQTAAGETHYMQNDEVKVHDEVGQLTWKPHAKIPVERRIPEDGTHSKLRDEGKDSEGEPQLTLNPQSILIEKTATIEHTPKDEIHFSQDEEIEASEGGTQLAWNPDARIAVEESSLEDEIQSKLSDEMRVSQGEPQLTMNPQGIQMENTAAEGQSPKDETQYNLKEAKTSDCETRLTSDNYHALSVEKISPTDTKLRRSEEEKEEEESNEMQESPTNESLPEQSAGLDLEKLPPSDTKHKKGDLEEEEKEKESSEMQEIPFKMLNLEHGGQVDSEKLSHRDIKHSRREEDEEKWEEGEESKGMQEIPPNRSSNEQGAELDVEKLSSTETKYKRRDLDEKEEEEKSSKMQEVPSKRSYHEHGRELSSKGLSPKDSKHRRREDNEEEEKKGENSKEMQEISSDRSSNEQGVELDVEKLSRIDTKHKRREEEEQEEEEEEEEEPESNKMQEVPSKRSCHEQDSKVELAPSTPYIDNASIDGNNITPETSYYSAALSIQAVSPHRASLLGSEYDAASRDNDVTDIETTLSLEVQISSASGSDQDSKSVPESTIELDSDDNDNDGKIWEEIHAVRKIVGYKEDPHPSYTEEIKALYVFTGVEPPASLENSFDLVKAKEKLKFLKVVVGVK